VKPALRTYRHDFVETKGQHWLAVCMPFYDGPRSAKAYISAARIYTRDLCFSQGSGELVYGVCRVPALGASEHVLTLADIYSAALWGAWGWEWLWCPAIYPAPTCGPDWLPPALLPSLDTSATPRNPPL
jgi:hypothetical protein